MLAFASAYLFNSFAPFQDELKFHPFPDLPIKYHLFGLLAFLSVAKNLPFL